MKNNLNLAEQFIHSTNSHVFLTGKAGTGKTTFLKHITKTTTKNFVVVAPTGIAALNANGVTIHSQFLLPFGAYLSEPTDFSEDPTSNFYSRNQLNRKHPLNSERKKVLSSLELLIIDEVSMLRADILDAIDYRLKAAKNRFNTPFGGVQLLLIGDLFQLPPIVKDSEWRVLKQFYASIHFFESNALKKAGYTYIELDKIFRQSNQRFIGLLNNLRTNACTKDDLELLNSHVRKRLNDKAVTLTTHNKQANNLNAQALNRLTSKTYQFYAHIEGNFPESLFPLPEVLELKEGARVMFTRNDTDGNSYFNGKMATVKSLSDEEIYVQFDDEQEAFLVPEHEWTNKKYKINENTKEIEEEVTGSFFHYPLKLAWAITVHKSQGLTFEAANLLVDKAFAPGQVYVALSRLKSLDGLQLSEPIAAHAILNDEKVGDMANQHKAVDLTAKLSVERQKYFQFLYHEAFSLVALDAQLKFFLYKHGAKLQFEDEKLQGVLHPVQKEIVEEGENVRKFMLQLDGLLSKGEVPFLKRLQEGRTYFLTKLHNWNYTVLLFAERLKTLSKTKTVVTSLQEIDQTIAMCLRRLEVLPNTLQSLTQNQALVDNSSVLKQLEEKRQKMMQEVRQEMKDKPLTISTKTGKKSKRKPKGETYTLTYNLIKDGKALEEIAKERKLAVSTIEAHAAKGVKEGELDVKLFLTETEQKVLKDAFEAKSEEGLAAVYQHLDKGFSFGQLRIYQASIGKRKTN